MNVNFILQTSSDGYIYPSPKADYKSVRTVGEPDETTGDQLVTAVYLPSGELPDGVFAYTEIEEDEIVETASVTARRFTQQLLGTNVFAALLVTRNSLAANINTISEGEQSLLGLLDAAKEMLNQGGLIDLGNSDVSLLLDVSISLPSVPFTAEDKARVLRNEAAS